MPAWNSVTTEMLNIAHAVFLQLLTQAGSGMTDIEFPSEGSEDEEDGPRLGRQRKSWMDNIKE